MRLRGRPVRLDPVFEQHARDAALIREAGSRPGVTIAQPIVLRLRGPALNEHRRPAHEAKRQENQQRLADLLARAQIPRHVTVSHLLAWPKEDGAALAQPNRSAQQNLE